MGDYTSQRDRVLNMLLNAGTGWVSVKDFMLAGISRFGARIFDLRREGFEIESKEHNVGRARHVSYRIVSKEQGRLS